MIHLGDITKISGHTAPTVDVIIGGSPCQDLSIAGKRAGLDGERSGLFMEQIRIIKEMRENDIRRCRTGVDVRPRYMVWENVPGAFSSNKGEDFRIVLEETAKVADKDAFVPMPNKGKWTTSGCIMGDGWSIAWRILDAQFWGVPQRRRRIALVADFGGQSASEILFVRKSLSGDTEQSKQERERTSSDAQGSTGADDRERVYCIELGAAKRLGGYVWEGLAPTLRTEVGDNRPSVAYTLKIRSGCEGGGKGALIQTDKSATLSTLQDQTLFQPVSKGDVIALDRAAYNQGINAQYDFEVNEEGVNSTLVAKGPSAVCYGIGAYHSNAWKSDNPHSGVYEADTSKTLDAINCGYPGCNQGGMAVVQGINGDKTGTLDASYYKGCGMREGKERDVVAVAHNAHYIIRRLTPLECERLQGFPDGWTDIGDWVDSKGKVKKASDAARYKALGNSIAIPPWKWVMKRLCACYERDATMASLFDGIGGFPYIWEQINGKGSCLWASEIEEFPIAVTTARFGECT